MKHARLLVSLMSALVLVALPFAARSGPAAAAASTPMKVGWWAGQSIGLCAADPLSCPRDNSSYTTAVWDALQNGGGFLNFDLVYNSDFGPTVAGVNRRTDALPIIQEANRRGVTINAWITVPLNKGTFANENNAATIQDAVKSFKAWSATNGLQFGKAILDMEFPTGYQPIYDAITNNDTSGIKALASANIDPAHQCAAIHTYRQTIAWAHANGVSLAGAPVFFALDDAEDGNLAMSDLMDLAPIIPDYDALYLQAYRADGIDLGSGLVADYYTEMQAMYGAKGQVSLGGTGVPPYDKVGPVISDVRMLATLGASEVPIFDFDSSVKAYGADGISQVLAAAQQPMSPTELAAARQPSPFGTGARALFRGLDTWAGWSTPGVTLAAWHPQIPNAYPTNC